MQQCPHKYLHPLPDADAENLTALERIRKPSADQPGGGGPGGAGSDQDTTD